MKILVYSDCEGFGGHEIMALVILRELARLPLEIHCACSSRNARLAVGFTEIIGEQVTQIPIRTRRHSILTDIFNRKKINLVRSVIRHIAPNCIVAIQGTIEISSLCLLAAKLEKVPVVTYIAITDSMKDLGIPYAFIRDMVDRYYYRLPARYVTIGATQKRQLVEHGVPEGKVAIVQNIVRLNVADRYERAEARSLLGLDASGTYVGIIGRVDIKTKGHNYLVDALRDHQHSLRTVTFLVVGSGDDTDALLTMITVHGLAERFVHIPWTENMNLVYSALDAVVIPSNNEAVPLVMIEAVLLGLPVVASSIGGLKEHLPGEWLFPRGNVGMMTERLTSILLTDQSELIKNIQVKFQEVFLRRTIGEEFFRELAAVSIKYLADELSFPVVSNSVGKTCR